MRAAEKRHGSLFLLCCAFAALLVLPGFLRAANALPPAPKNYFNDFANVTRPATAPEMERALEEFERSQSVQIVVAVFPKLPDGEALEDFAQRAAAAWKVGRKGLNNGAVLFVFIQDKKMRIEIGYGLEGKIPDAIAKRITSEQIKPFFARGDYDGGIRAGTRALMEAARGEYKGTGSTAARKTPWPIILFGAFIALVVLSSLRRRRGTMYSRRSSGWGMPMIWGGGGGWSSGGGGGGDSGGGFSGGGGDFGGGGASDSW